MIRLAVRRDFRNARIEAEFGEFPLDPPGKTGILGVIWIADAERKDFEDCLWEDDRCGTRGGVCPRSSGV